MILNKIRAGYPGLYLVTHEEQRAESMLVATVDALRDKHDQVWTLQCWTATQGRFAADGTFNAPDEDAMNVLDAVVTLPEKSILILKDYHVWLEQGNPILLRKLKDALYHAKANNITLVFLAPTLPQLKDGIKLPVDLEKLVAIIEFTLPDKTQLAAVLDRILSSNQLDPLVDLALDNALAAAAGLTTNEAEDAFALSIIETGAITPSVIAREKAETIKKNGILEIIHTQPGDTLDNVGGLDAMKVWLKRRRHAFSHQAAAYQLPTPKGMLVFGIPGTGKSLTAKATASAFGDLPLVKLDAGKIFGSLVGQSEGNLQTVIRTAEAIAPCILWIDEIEKGFAKSTGGGDGGTTERVFGSLLQWMTDKKAPVFVVATANDVTKLDSALIRKGRFDELFFVDLPDSSEREAIWKIQIAKYGRDPKKFDCSILSEMTANCTGSEIECILGEALNLAFEDNREPTPKDIAIVLQDFVPLSKMMADDIRKLQDFAKGRARRATSQAPVTMPKTRKLAA